MRGPCGAGRDWGGIYEAQHGGMAGGVSLKLLPDDRCEIGESDIAQAEIIGRRERDTTAFSDSGHDRRGTGDNCCGDSRPE